MLVFVLPAEDGLVQIEMIDPLASRDAPDNSDAMSLDAVSNGSRKRFREDSESMPDVDIRTVSTESSPARAGGWDFGVAMRQDGSVLMRCPNEVSHLGVKSGANGDRS